jgi:uncharacterized membrane protein YvbJ
MDDAFFKGIINGIYLAIFVFIYQFIKYVYRKLIASKVEDLAPVVNAVVNHSKDTISQIRPAVTAYVEKHQTTMSQYCIHCGNKCENDAAFCVKCGRTVQE